MYVSTYRECKYLKTDIGACSCKIKKQKFVLSHHSSCKVQQLKAKVQIFWFWKWLRGVTEYGNTKISLNNCRVLVAE